MLRHFLQRIVICGNGFLIASAPGQRIASVIVTLGVVRVFQSLHCALVVAGAMLCYGLPGRIRKQRAGRRIILRLHGALSLLVFAQPQTPPLQRLRRIRRTNQQGGQGKYNPAPTKQQGRQRQQAQYQPRPLFAPQICLKTAIKLFHLTWHGGKIIRQQRNIALVCSQPDIPPTPGLRQLSQFTFGQHRDNNLTIRALQKTPVGERHRDAVQGADAQYGKPVATGAQRLGRILRQCQFHLICDQQDMPLPGAGLFEQLPGARQRLVCAITQRRHDGGIERLQLRLDRSHIIRQWRHSKCLPGIDQQRGLPLPTLVQQVPDLKTRAPQTAGRYISGIHGARQVQGDHQGIPGAVHRLRQLFPDRPGQRDDPQQAANCHQCDGTPARPPCPAQQYVRQQIPVADRLPTAAARLSHKHQPEQQRQRRQGQEPQWPEKVKLCRVEHQPGARNLRTPSNRPDNNAAASGQ